MVFVGEKIVVAQAKITQHISFVSHLPSRDHPFGALLQPQCEISILQTLYFLRNMTVPVNVTDTVHTLLLVSGSGSARVHNGYDDI